MNSFSRLSATLPVSLEHSSTTSVVLASAFVLLLALIQRLTRRAARPPGPPGLPFVGNAFQFNQENAWRKFDEWSEQYGDVVFLRVFSKSLLVLNSFEAAVDLQEKRAAVYSDRPYRVMAELSNFDSVTTFRTRYDDDVKLAKRYLHLECTKSNVAKHSSRQESVAAEYVELLKKKPEGFQQHVQDTIISVIQVVFFGDRAIFKGLDAFEELSAEVLQQFTKMATPSRYRVDTFPILRHVPSWFPGAQFQREAARNRRQIYRFMNEPYLAVKKQMEGGVVLPSFLSTILCNEDLTPEKEETIKNAASSAYGAGFDTTVASMTNFFLAMVLNPEIQVRAQAEIDAVVGKGRLPSFSDRASLPYVNAIVSEVLRWRASVPFAWRRLRSDDVYKGYTIPAGTLVTVNTRALTHNTTWYPEPDQFRPERFIDENGQYSTLHAPDPRKFVFGFGRRACPGMHLADSFLYILVASTLAAVKMSPETDEKGNPVYPAAEYVPGLGGISQPAPFKCKIEARA